MKKYFIHDGNEQKGPFSLNELQDLGILPNSNIWYEGLENWQKASTIEELKGLFSKTPPPFTNSTSTQPPPTTPPRNTNTSQKKKSKTSSSIRIFLIAIVAILLISFFIQKNVDTKVESALINKDYDELLEKQKRLEEEKKEIRNNIGNYISIRQSNYSADKFFGGITDLNYEVSNRSDYTIDLVKIEVRYIRTNGGLFKTEIVNIENIKPRGAITGYAPNSNKGVTVEYNVLGIYSNELSLCYKKDEYSSNANDPYKCN